jgi:hypothetical protein
MVSSHEPKLRQGKLHRWEAAGAPGLHAHGERAIDVHLIIV